MCYNTLRAAKPRKNKSEAQAQPGSDLRGATDERNEVFDAGHSPAAETECRESGKRLADVMELADMQDLGSCAERRGGSSPFIRTSGSGVRGFEMFIISNPAPFSKINNLLI